jgi:hypothetical protein
MKGWVVEDVEELERKFYQIVVGGKQIAKVNGTEDMG